MIETRPIRKQDQNGIIAVTETLPDWFDEDARKRSIPIDLQHQHGCDRTHIPNPIKYVYCKH